MAPDARHLSARRREVHDRMKRLLCAIPCALFLFLPRPEAAAAEGATGSGNTGPAGGETAAPADLAALRRLRAEAARSPRRLLFNNDADDILLAAEATPEALLVQRTGALAGSQVDAVSYGASGCFGNARYASGVWEPFTTRDDWFADHNRLPDFLARGIDPMRVMVDFCHAHRMELFWGLRVNDTHDAALSARGAAMRPRLKREHPEYLVGTPDRRPPYGTWSSVDFAMPEVRELAYRFVEEACRRYALDGIDLDFFRHPCFFRSVAWGGQASAEELAQMTELMRRIREATEQEGLRRGRPILVSIRVPDSVEYCRGIGIDLERWLADGLVDLLAGPCYFQLNPWEYLVQLGHRHGVRVYPVLSDTRVRGEARFRRGSIESYRGRAMQAWGAGADGLYLFNYFKPQGPVWRELGELASLRGKDKLFFLSPLNGRPETYLANGSRHQSVPILTPQNPWPLPEAQPVDLELALGDEIGEAQRAGSGPRVTCHVRTIGGTGLTASLGGVALPPPTAADGWWDFAVPVALVRPGSNRFRLLLPEQSAADEGTWTAVYESSALPASPWEKDGFAATTGMVAELQDGTLLIADRSTETGSWGYFRVGCAIRPELETVIEARLKTLAGTSSIIIENGVLREVLQFAPDGIRATTAGVSASTATSDAFHSYRIIMQGNDMRVYADSQLQLDATGRLKTPKPGASSGVWFGAASSATTGEALWESVKVRSRAVSLLDVVVSCRYGGE